MDGLMPNNEQAPAAVAPPTGGPPAAGPTAGAAPKAPAATPEEQAAYDQFVKNGMTLIYDKKALPALVKSLDGNGKPQEGMINTLGGVVQRLVGSAKQAGTSLTPNVVLHGAGELLEQLADFSAQSGGHKYSDDELAQLANAIVGGMTGKPPGPGQPAAPDTAAPPGGGGGPLAAAQPPATGLMG